MCWVAAAHVWKGCGCSVAKLWQGCKGLQSVANIVITEHSWHCGMCGYETLARELLGTTVQAGGRGAAWAVGGTGKRSGLSRKALQLGQRSCSCSCTQAEAVTCDYESHRADDQSSLPTFPFGSSYNVFPHARVSQRL